MTQKASVRSIIFSSEEVRATLFRAKSRFTRPIWPQPRREGMFLQRLLGTTASDRSRHVGKFCWGMQVIVNHERHYFSCPLGEVGDELWVKETWQDCPQCGRVNWKATANDHGRACQHCDGFLSRAWSSPVVMTEDDSRLRLRLTDIQAQRVQEIDEGGAIAEGVAPLFRREEIFLKEGYRAELDLRPMPWRNYLWHGYVGESITATQSDDWREQASCYPTAKGSFSSLWHRDWAQPRPIRSGGHIVAYRSFPWKGRSGELERRGKPHYAYANPWVWIGVFDVVSGR